MIAAGTMGYIFDLAATVCEPEMVV
jgi:hypothetical protein